MSSTYVISYDIGTTGNKTCLYEIADDMMRLVAQTSRRLSLALLENGGAEQDPVEWWQSVCETTPEVIALAGLRAEDIAGIAFCCQTQGVLFVDETGTPLRPAMNYMDKRAQPQFEAFCDGPVRVAGFHVNRLITYLNETTIIAGSARDPVFKYIWFRDNEPELFARTHKWLDVKDYLLYRCTGRYVATEDGVFTGMIYNPKKHCVSDKILAMHGIKKQHLPEIVRSTESLGYLSEEKAREMGLSTACQVFAGGVDCALINVGAGSTHMGDTHVYIGTSGWVSTVVDKPMVDLSCMIASLVGADWNRYNYYGELETSGKCLEWARDTLVVDNTGTYAGEPSEDAIRLLCETAAKADAGSGGVLFTPWLPGSRCPFEDADARGMFFNLRLSTGKAELLRAVLEGIAFHMRWMLERTDMKIATSKVIRIVGGGARSPVLCQIFADILRRPVERIENPQNAGAMGAAILVAVGLGLLPAIEDADQFANIDARFEPNSAHTAVYEKNYAVFKELYASNKAHFHALNKNKK
ncbi:FGGY-family carbohydrate kinase [Christensenellaceae bacterium OttesenSCG-928-L17]|nr:FGGY-family carbohydrate kinase [Christensenellaceae bacterium OttesenSCG-928-L17]